MSSVLGSLRGDCSAQLAAAKSPLFSAPLELTGDWRESPPEAVLRVLSRTRDVSLFGIELFSDRQPATIRVESRTEGFPAIWLHDENACMAWILVTIGDCDWCQLSYQFGHELGHVLCNSWDRLAYPSAPCQWLEESLVEAFTIRGLDLLAASWERNPPFDGDNGFAKSIRQYRNNLITGYGAQMPNKSCAAWFRKARASLELRGGESDAEGPATLGILAELEKSNACVGDLGAVNRWPLRSGVPVEDYLALWETSCKEIGAPGQLPNRLRRLLNVS
jgi:hypothetical protein